MRTDFTKIFLIPSNKTGANKMFKASLDYYLHGAILGYATFRVQLQDFTRPLYSRRCNQNTHKGGSFISGIAQPRKNVHVSPRPILRHGSPAAVIVHQRRTENHRGVKQAQGVRPTLLNQVSKDRLGSRPTLRIWLELAILCLKRLMHTDCSHWRKGRFCSGSQSMGACAPTFN